MAWEMHKQRMRRHESKGRHQWHPDPSQTDRQARRADGHPQPRSRGRPVDVEPQLDTLSQHFSVLTYDIRGHGGSSATPGDYSLALLAQDVLALMDHLGVEQAHYVGLSLGGMIASTWAPGTANACRASRCARPLAKHRKRPGKPRVREAREIGVAPLAEATVDRWVTPEFKREQPELMAKMRAMVLGTSLDGYAGSAAAIRDMELAAVLGRIAIPTLVVAGEADTSTPLPILERIAHSIPGAQLVTIANAAHMPTLERPELAIRRSNASCLRARARSNPFNSGILMTGRLSGKRIIITGAIGNIGKEAARGFIAEGARVVIGDIAEDAGRAVVAELGNAAHFVQVDVTREESVANLVARGVEWLGGLDALAQNAGLQRSGAIAEFGQADWGRTLRGQRASAFLRREVRDPAPEAIGQGLDHQHVVACRQTRRARPGRLFGIERRGDRVHDRARARTRPRQHPRERDLPRLGRYRVQPARDRLHGRRDAQQQKIASLVPLGRQASAQEIAPLFVYLASDESAYVTAQSFGIDGGVYNG